MNDSPTSATLAPERELIARQPDSAEGLFLIAAALGRIADALDRFGAHGVANLAKLASAQQTLASAIPHLPDDRARWMFHVAPTAIRRWPSFPEKIEDVRSRCAILALGLGEKLAEWSLPEEERKALWAKQRAEFESKNGAVQSAPILADSSF